MRAMLYHPTQLLSCAIHLDQYIMRYSLLKSCLGCITDTSLPIESVCKAGEVYAFPWSCCSSAHNSAKTDLSCGQQGAWCGPTKAATLSSTHFLSESAVWGDLESCWELQILLAIPAYPPYPSSSITTSSRAWQTFSCEGLDGPFSEWVVSVTTIQLATVMEKQPVVTHKCLVWPGPLD